MCVPEYSDDESFSDDVDSGVTRRQEALHILQRRQLGIIPDIEWWDQPLLRRQPEMDRLDDEDPDFPYVIAEVRYYTTNLFLSAQSVLRV